MRVSFTQRQTRLQAAIISTIQLQQMAIVVTRYLMVRSHVTVDMITQSVLLAVTVVSDRMRKTIKMVLVPLNLSSMVSCKQKWCRSNTDYICMPRVNEHCNITAEELYQLPFCLSGKSVECDPSQGPCCKSTCGFEPSTTECRPVTECAQAAYCDSSQAACPASNFTNLDGELCNSKTQVCNQGVSGTSLFIYYLIGNTGLVTHRVGQLKHWSGNLWWLER